MTGGAFVPVDPFTCPSSECKICTFYPNGLSQKRPSFILKWPDFATNALLALSFLQTHTVKLGALLAVFPPVENP